MTDEGQADLLEFSSSDAKPDGKVRIIMDERERASNVRHMLEEKGAEVKQVVLNVGDFILSDRIVVERKTRADFESSIIDGRLFTQLPAMAANYVLPPYILKDPPRYHAPQSPKTKPGLPS